MCFFFRLFIRGNPLRTLFLFLFLFLARRKYKWEDECTSAGVKLPKPPHLTAFGSLRSLDTWETSFTLWGREVERRERSWTYNNLYPGARICANDSIKHLGNWKVERLATLSWLADIYPRMAEVWGALHMQTHLFPWLTESWEAGVPSFALRSQQSPRPRQSVWERRTVVTGVSLKTGRQTDL